MKQKALDEDLPPDAPPRLELGSSPTYRVVLLDAAGGRHPVSSYASSGTRHHEALAEGIRRFLADRTARREWVDQPGRPFLGAVILLLPLVLLFLRFLCHSEFSIDRDAGMFVGIGSKLFPQLAMCRLPLSEIREFNVQVSKDRDDPHQLVAEPILRKRDGTTISLSRFWLGGWETTHRLIDVLERRRAELERAEDSSRRNPA